MSRRDSPDARADSDSHKGLRRSYIVLSFSTYACRAPQPSASSDRLDASIQPSPHTDVRDYHIHESAQEARCTRPMPKVLVGSRFPPISDGSFHSAGLGGLTLARLMLLHQGQSESAPTHLPCNQGSLTIHSAWANYEWLSSRFMSRRVLFSTTPTRPRTHPGHTRIPISNIQAATFIHNLEAVHLINQ